MGCIALMTGAEKRHRSAGMGKLAIYSFALPAPGSERGWKKHTKRQKEEKSQEEPPWVPQLDDRTLVPISGDVELVVPSAAQLSA